MAEGERPNTTSAQIVPIGKTARQNEHPEFIQFALAC
jgi:hypothetical protein